MSNEARAREIKRRLHDIANGITLRECADSDAHFLHDLADNLPAITQALTESSGQDGIVVPRAYLSCLKDVLREVAIKLPPEVDVDDLQLVRAQTKALLGEEVSDGEMFSIPPRKSSGQGTDGAWLVWSHEHGAWWRPDRCGYTVHVKSAGRYTREEALSICKHSRDGWTDEGPPSEIPVRESDVLALKSKQPSDTGVGK